MVKLTTGITVDLSHLQSTTLLDGYLEQRRTKDKLKDDLRCLSDAVHAETVSPLVFIIDELDRCRPMFAIELLEKVKHIFDIPNMVFVFGINRSELYLSRYDPSTEKSTPTSTYVVSSTLNLHSQR